MVSAALMVALLLIDGANLAQTTVTSKHTNAIPEAAIFALQIRKTSEATPAASDNGNNLNVVAATAPANQRDAISENFQAISANYYAFESEENTNKKLKTVEPADKSDLSFYEKVTKRRLKDGSHLQTERFDETIKPKALIWDMCMETMYQNNERNADQKKQVDIEYMNHEIQSQPPTHRGIYSNESVKKRDANNITNSTAMMIWLEKYNKLKNANSEERRQQKSDDIFVSRKINLTTTPVTTIQIIPITTEIGHGPIDNLNNNLDLKVTESTIKASFTNDWFEVDTREKTRKTRIKFGSLPQRETYLIPTLRLEEGFYPFGFVSELFALIHPFDFPAGLIKDIVWGEFTFPYSFLQIWWLECSISLEPTPQAYEAPGYEHNCSISSYWEHVYVVRNVTNYSYSIKVESAFLVFIVMFVCLALIIPAYLIIVALLSLFSRASRDDEMETGALFPDLEESDCNDRVLAVGTLFVLLICCALISGMVLSNEQATLATSDSRDALSCACADVAAWLAAAARELHQSLVPPVDIVLQAYRDDLRSVEYLLGEPIQKTIASESGIDLVLESLNDVIQESEDISSKISSLRDISMQAGSLASAAADRLKDLARQLDNLKKHCLGKDIPLCDTLNTQSLEVKMKFETILHEQQMLELRSLGVENLTRAIALAKQDFRTLPQVIATETTSAREDILRDMEMRRESIYRSSKILSDIVRHLTGALHSAVRKLETALMRFQSYDFWRWTVMLGSCVFFTCVITLIILAMMCDCRQAKTHAKRTLKVSTMWICLASFLLWSLISAIFLIAGHAEVYICHALWDSPQYKSLSSLLDRPSPLFANEEGFFDALFREMDNITLEVSVQDVLRDCEKDYPAYTVFQIDRVLDVNKATSYFEWDELQADLGRLATIVDIGFLKNVSVELSKILNQILSVSDVKWAKYRLEYNGPVVGRDLVSLADQLINVAAQVTDLTTSGRMETLASRTQRLHVSSVKPLEQLRAEVVFKLTELELQLTPFRKRLNISLSHIHTAQYYIDNQGDVIAQKKVSIYVGRLISHIAGWRTHALIATGHQAARCRPLFNVYHAARVLLCSRYVASLHGWWVCGFLLGMTWCGLTPLCVKLWRTYGRKIQAHDAMNLANLNTSHQETPTTVLCDSNNWNTPGPPPPPRSDSW